MRAWCATIPAAAPPQPDCGPHRQGPQRCDRRRRAVLYRHGPGLLAFDSDWHPLNTALTQRLTGVHVQNLMVDSLGRLWCGTYSDLGLVRYDPASGDITLFNSSNGLYSASIRVSYEMADGTVAVGTQDGLALIRDDEVAAFYNQGSGMETQSILCLTQAPNGTLLVGSAGSGI